MTLESPKGSPLQNIDGNPDDLLRSAKDLITSGEEMERSASRLEDISNGTSDLKSEAIAKLRENAGEVFPELRKAAIRYEGTGQALKKYAYALDRVQGALQLCTAEGGVDSYTSMGALITDIEDANQTAQTARSQEDTAEDSVDDANGFLGLSEGTDEEKEEAKSDLTKATAAREEAEEELRELWGKFDGRVSYWEDAYDEAVGEIEDAFKAADNDDKFLAGLVDVLSAVAAIAGLLALVVSGPLVAILGLIALGISLVLIAIEVGKFMNGDGSWADLGFAIVGIIPFGRVLGKVFTSLKGSKGFTGFFKSMAKSRTSRSNDLVKKSIHPSKSRPKMTKVHGDRKQRDWKKANNEKKKNDFKESHNRDKKKYLDGFEEEFSKNKFKMYVNYALDGRAAKERALVQYVLENPHQVTKKAENWAFYMDGLTGMENWGDYLIASGIDHGKSLVEEINKNKAPSQN